MSGGLIPERGSLVAECVRVMRLRIAAGEWREFLPGERRLAEILQVGRDTVRLMLGELESSAWIEVAAPGCRRRIVPARRGSRSANVSLKIGMLSPQSLERLMQPMLLEVDHIRRSLGDKGGGFEFYAPAWYDATHPEKRLEQLVSSESCVAWVLLRSSAAVQRWFEANRIPCLVRGYPQDGVGLPHLDVDWEATARHAAGSLWRLGHRRVGIIVPPDRLRGVEAAIRGMQSLGEEGFEAMELAEDGTLEGVSRMFTRAMALTERPTALVACRPRQVPTVLGCAAREGVGVPERLSVISLAREPYLEYLIPEVSGYRTDPAAVAKQVVRRLEQLVAGNPNPGGNPWIVPEQVKGRSVGPPSV